MLGGSAKSFFGEELSASEKQRRAKLKQPAPLNFCAATWSDRNRVAACFIHNRRSPD
jgi:hypothetical protein